MAVALAPLATTGCAQRGVQASRPNVVLVTVDTLRADHLGIYGYPRDTSPELDRLAREGVSSERCYSQSATTNPSHTTLFTSLHPQSHGVLSNRQAFPDRVTLMEVLRAEGYFMAGFVSSVALCRNFGIQRAFQLFDDDLDSAERNRPDQRERPGRATVRSVVSRLDELQRQAPFFLWVHLIDPHGPYDPPEHADRFVGDRFDIAGPPLEIGSSNFEFGRIPSYQRLDGRRDASFYVARYDAEIRYADEALGELFAALRARSLYDTSVIIVTADHGETLADPGHRRFFSHSVVAYEEVVRVPLIVRDPERGKEWKDLLARTATVGLVDIAPTLLHRLGIPSPDGFVGRDLFVNPRKPTEPVFSLGAYGSAELEKQVGSQHSVLEESWRLVMNTADGALELYDNSRDPGETRDIAPRHPERAARLRDDLLRFLATGTGPAAREMSPEQIEQLRALGYLR